MHLNAAPAAELVAISIAEKKLLSVPRGEFAERTAAAACPCGLRSGIRGFLSLAREALKIKESGGLILQPASLGREPFNSSRIEKKARVERARNSWCSDKGSWEECNFARTLPAGAGGFQPEEEGKSGLTLFGASSPAGKRAFSKSRLH